MRYATAAMDWFRNQAIPSDAIGIMALTPDKKLRAPQAGDNRRADLQWIVSLDLSRAKIERRVALETMRREGGSVLKRIPDGA